MTDTARTGELPVSILIPTIGRPDLLSGCLASLAACRPRPAEVLILDQSGRDETSAVVRSKGDATFRLIALERRGIPIALNAGLRAATHDVTFVTNDDCTVADTWVAVGWRLMREHPGLLATGRVLPQGDDRGVPSTITQTESEDLTGTGVCDRLYGGNMVVSRDAALAIGGFDELLLDAAEDNDFGYRWLKAGRPMRYEPALVVWHHDWRSPDQLRTQYIRYARGRGVFYGKSLRRRDLAVSRFLFEDLLSGARGARDAWRVRGTPDPWPDERTVMFPALFRGMIAGWRGASGGGGGPGTHVRARTDRA